MPLDHTPTPTPGGEWDFHPVFPTDSQGPQVAAPPKRARSIPEERIDPRLIDILDFMDWIHDTPEMRELLLPMNELLNTVRSQVYLMADLPVCDQVYQRWLSHLASNFGFKLIDMPFAEVNERRELVCEIVPLLKRRGTIWAVQRICEILGFSFAYSLDFKVNGRFNRSRFFSPKGSASSVLSFDWDDGTLQGWTSPAQLHDVIAQRLHGDIELGWNDPLYIGCYIPEASADYCCKFKYQIVGTGDCRMGFVVNTDGLYLTGILVELYKSGVTEKLRLRNFVSGYLWYTSAEADISGLDWRTGEHQFIIWDQQAKLTAAIDQTTVFSEVSTGTATDRKWKGLWSAGGTEAYFDDFRLYAVDRRKQARFWHGDFEKRMTITLSGSPSHKAAKREYLAKIIPDWVPYDIDIVWA